MAKNIVAKLKARPELICFNLLNVSLDDDLSDILDQNRLQCQNFSMKNSPICNQSFFVDNQPAPLEPWAL